MAKQTPTLKAKKHFGQHFLRSDETAQTIVNGLGDISSQDVLEIGPGMGIITQFMVTAAKRFQAVEIDPEAATYLEEHFEKIELIKADFLKINIRDYYQDQFSLIGNFPYNISSQILFKVLENRDQVVELVGMFQKEVAQRCAEKPGSKEYGILSVFLQAYYKVEYLFSVKPGVFNPPPKVNSAVIRLTRNEVSKLDCDEKLFWQVVKAGFNQRRKTLRNALSSIFNKESMGDDPMLDLRAERLSVDDFVKLTNLISSTR